MRRLQYGIRSGGGIDIYDQSRVTAYGMIYGIDAKVIDISGNAEVTADSLVYGIKAGGIEIYEDAVVKATVRCILAADYGSAAMIIGATIGIVGTVTGVAYAFYSHKAKAENIVKIAQSLTKEDVDEVATLAQSMGGLQ
ncbi:hypothetical protein FACS1894202_10920 [Clostridia bacterium]|nr:hypothetical protein FACS1894202_10920 [Clostridia bacterium]